MVTKLDECYIVKDTKDKEEYLEKIYAFINKYPNLKPLDDNRALERGLSHISGLGNLKCVQTKYFTSAKNLGTTNYSIHIVYSPLLKCKLVYMSNPWSPDRKGWIVAPKNIMEMTNSENLPYYFTIQSIKRLYKLLVTDVVDGANILRKIKQAKLVLEMILSAKYHYSPSTHECTVFSNMRLDYIRQQIHFNKTILNVKQPHVSINTANGWGESYSFDAFINKYNVKGAIHTNDFMKDILPTINDDINSHINKIMANNPITIQNFCNI